MTEVIAPSDTPARTEVSVHEGAEAVAAALDPQLTAAVGAARVAAWTARRDRYHPELWVAREDGIPVAALLAAGRPATAATTVVEPWWTSPSAASGLVAAATDRALARGDVAMKWQSAAELPPFAEDAGFVPLRAPLGAVGTESTRGAVRWLENIAHPEPAYYAQTTMYTCGAVAALLGAALRGADGFAADGVDRDRELSFWRRASNFPACEPVGLAVATAEHLASSDVEVALDADGPVLVEDYRGFDLSFRAELQAESRRRAGELGLAVRQERVDVAEIARRVARGELALLLIDEEPMHGEHGPHWVLAHASDDVDVVVIEDPWINRETGETWVDTHELPVRLSDLDLLVRWSDAGYRGVVFIG